jgi:hypothetical protein
MPSPRSVTSRSIQPTEMPLRSLPVGIKQGRNSHTNGNGISNSITNVAADGGGDDFDPDYGLKFTVKVRGRVSMDVRVSTYCKSKVEYARTEYISIHSIQTEGRNQSYYLTSGAAVLDDTEREPANAQRYTATAARENLPTSSLTLTDKSPLSQSIFLPAFPVLADDEVSSSPSLATSRFKTKPSKARACSIWQQADLKIGWR